ELRRFKKISARVQAGEISHQIIRFAGGKNFVTVLDVFRGNGQGSGRALALDFVLCKQIRELRHHRAGNGDAWIIKMDELRDGVRTASADVRQVRTDPDIAQKNMTVVNEILKNAIARAPAPFEV